MLISWMLSWGIYHSDTFSWYLPMVTPLDLLIRDGGGGGVGGREGVVMVGGGTCQVRLFFEVLNVTSS